MAPKRQRDDSQGPETPSARPPLNEGTQPVSQAPPATARHTSSEGATSLGDAGATAGPTGGQLATHAAAKAAAAGASRKKKAMSLGVLIEAGVIQDGALLRYMKVCVSSHSRSMPRIQGLRGLSLARRQAHACKHAGMRRRRAIPVVACPRHPAQQSRHALVWRRACMHAEAGDRTAEHACMHACALPHRAPVWPPAAG